MLHFLLACIVIYVFLSLIWPATRTRQAADGSKRQELADAVGRLERLNAPPAASPPKPTHNSAERARVLALGRIRDGAKRHPILDTDYVSVANPPKKAGNGLALQEWQTIS